MFVRHPLDTIGQFEKLSAPAWNYVDCGVRRRIPLVQAVGEADAKTIWLQAGKQPRADFAHQSPQDLLFRHGKLVDCSDVFARRDERVAVSDGIGGGDRERVLRLDPGAVAFDGAEEAVGQVRSIAPCFAPLTHHYEP